MTGGNAYSWTALFRSYRSCKRGLETLVVVRSCQLGEYRVSPVSKKKCQQCRKTFIGANSSKFCSDHCRNVARPEGYYRPDFTCQVCGKIYKGRAESKYCSDRCKGDAFANFNKEEQRCAECGQWKPHFEFGKNAARPSGLDHLCKPCPAIHAAKSMRGVGRFSRAKAITKARGKGWELTRGEYEELANRPCHYCGFPINETGIGLDRISDTQVYRADTVLPACAECNRIRSDKYSVEEMLVIGKTLAQLKQQRLHAELPLPATHDGMGE